MDQNTIIRKVRKEDNSALAKVIREVFEEHDAPRIGTVYSDPTTDNLYELFRTSRSVLWVAETESAIIGCCGIYPTEGLPENYAELVKFYLSQNARGKGTGKELMDLSIRSAIEFGYKKLYLESLFQFSKAVRIYEKQGFKKLSLPLGKSGHSNCDIWMEKKLSL
jgi:putative acetyltransferase